MSENVLEWLLEEENPSVRFYVMTSLFGKSPYDPDVIEARTAIMTQGKVPKILSLQNADGSWEIPEKFYDLKYTGTVWTLLLLAELAADPLDPRVQKACEFILQHSQNPETGGFSHAQSAKTQTGLVSGVIPCLTGNMTYSLIRLGYLEDSRVQSAINWITKYQRADDAIDYTPEGEMYRKLYPCWGRHSCHMGVAKALKALAAVPPEKRSPEISAKIDELTEYFLKHHLYKKSHNLDEISRPGWLKLGFPLMYQTDILELLSIFDDLGIKDPRLDDAIEILKSKQGSDGKWILESSNNGKMLVTIEKKGSPSKWITLRACKVLDG